MKWSGSTWVLLMSAAAVSVCPAADDPRWAALSPEEAGIDFTIQGEYTGEVSTDGGPMTLGLQVIARGNGRFDAVAYPGGLPGDGWDGDRSARVFANGQLSGDVCVLEAVDGRGRAEIRDGQATILANGSERGVLKRIVRRSPTLGAAPPDGAIVLFDGSSVDEFEEGVLSPHGFLQQGATTRRRFGSYRLHLEFLLSWMPYATSQGRSNSGCYHQGRYEIQILDSFGLDGRDNECGAIYRIAPPAVNMCFPPLSWQTYDVEFHAATYDESGKKTEDAWITAYHNGVKIHERQRLDHATTASPWKEGPEDGPIYLQDHGNPVRFRNIWIVPE